MRLFSLVCVEDGVIYLAVMLDKMELHSFLDEVCKVVHISLIGLRKEYASNVSTLGLKERVT